MGRRSDEKLSARIEADTIVDGANPNLHTGTGNTDGVKARILQHAKMMFADRGFSGASLRAIADSANVKFQLINYYFGSKEDLWFAVIDSLYETYARTFTALEFSSLEPHHVSFKRHVLQLVKFYAANPHNFRIIIRELLAESKIFRRVVSERAMMFTKVWLAYVARAQGAGIAKELDPSHFLFMLQGCIMFRFFVPPVAVSLSGRPLDDDDVLSAYADSVSGLFIGTCNG